MNVLFLSLLDFNSFDERNIYSDLLREFIKNGHSVFCISPVERRKKQETKLLRFENSSILKLKIGNTQKVHLIEKGISTLLIEPLFIKGIKKFYSDIKFDLVLYATPPITFAKVIRFIKKRDDAKSYLMLKDIFPQNSVDLGMLRTTGIKGLIYRFFRRKEKQLYWLSDHIGCMSQANVDYIIKHNPEVDPQKVEVFPNSVEPVDMSVSAVEKYSMRDKYGIPQDKTVFVYGGNLGRPQDVPFIVNCLSACSDIANAFFVIAGSGTDRHFFEEYVEAEKPKHVKLFGQLPKEEYDRMIACCDIGLIFLDYRFTIPNFPSRLLSYMQAKLPVLACTDPNTDIGDVIEKGGFGWQCRSNDVEAFHERVAEIVEQKDIAKYKDAAFEFLKKNYSVEQSVQMLYEQKQGES